jgi:type II secretory pathway component PulJ
MTKLNKRGYTVAELLIAISVSVLIVTVLSSMSLVMYRQLQISRTTAELNNESQQILRAVVEDIRLAGGLLNTNTIEDNYSPAGGWITNDPSNVLIIASPAVNNSSDVIYDENSGLPYKNELIYFSEGNKLKRRTLKNINAEGNTSVTTCPSTNDGCKLDREFSINSKDIAFTFYDDNDQTTTDASSSRSVNFTVTLEKKASGKTIKITNSMRTTLRNR